MTFKEVFGADGPFMRIGTEIWEIIYANILWLLFGGPFFKNADLICLFAKSDCSVG